MNGPQRLGATAAKGAAAVLTGQFAKLLIQLLSVVLYARLLDPEDFGLVAMSVAIVGVAAVVRDFGLGQAAIQSPTLTAAQRVNLFWINTALGGGFAIAALLLARPLAHFLEDPRAAGVILCIAPIFLLGGICTQARAELSRSMRFKTLIRTEVLSAVGGVSVGLACAAAGVGYWALVAQQVAEATLLMLTSLLATSWRMRPYSRGVPLRQFWRYGAPLAATQVMVYASQNVDSILIGRMFGANALGFWNRAFQILMVPLNQIASPATKVALPILSRADDGHAGFDRFLLRAHLLVSTGVTLILSGAIATADPLINILLGDGWERSADYLKILAIGGCFQAVNYATFWCFLARGRTAANLRFSLLSRSVTIVALILASTHSVMAIAWTYSSCLALAWLLGLLWVRDFAPSRALAAQSLQVLARAGLAGSLGLVAAVFVSSTGDWPRLIVSGCVVVAAYGTLLAAAKVRSEILSTLKLIGSRR